MVLGWRCVTCLRWARQTRCCSECVVVICNNDNGESGDAWIKCVVWCSTSDKSRGRCDKLGKETKYNIMVERLVTPNYSEILR